VLTVYIALTMLLVVAATGAPLTRLAHLRLSRTWLLWAALIDQILVISIIPDSFPTALSAAHIASYLAAGACVWANRHTAGVPLIGAGGALNGLIITLNGGTLPASNTAVEASGQGERLEHFNNSAVLADPKLAMFGDVFATPAWLPGSNVFSIGDLAIWIGLAWLLWRTCRPGASSRHRRPAGYAGRHAAARSLPEVRAAGAAAPTPTFRGTRQPVLTAATT
jgi:hypothetical protein